MTEVLIAMQVSALVYIAITLEQILAILRGMK